MTRQIKYLFSKERVSVLLKKKKIFNKQGDTRTQQGLLKSCMPHETPTQQKQVHNEKHNEVVFVSEMVLPVRNCATGGSFDKERAPQNRTENRSQYGIRLSEFKKIMNLYTNISKKYLKTRIKLFHNTPTKIEENFFRYLESRLDVVLYRASFFDSICSARQAIRSGEVLVNRIAVKTPAQILKPGDFVSLLQKEDFSYFRSTKRLNKEILSPLKKVETLLFENAFKKRKDHLSLQSQTRTQLLTQDRLVGVRSGVIDFILSSTRTEAFSPFRKINFSEKKVASNYVTRRSESGVRCGSSFTNTTSNTNTNTTKLCFSLCSDNEKQEPNLHTTSNTTFNTTSKMKMTRNITSFSSCLINTRSKNTSKKTSFSSCSCEPLLLKNTAIENLLKNNLPSYAKDILSCNFLRQPLAQQKKVKIENSRYAIIKKPLSSFNPDLTNEDCFIVLNYYLYLKRVLQKNWTMKQGHSFKSTKIFKKGKPAHLEVSYTSLSIIFLFPPQFIKFSDFINYSDIFK